MQQITMNETCAMTDMAMRPATACWQNPLELVSSHLFQTLAASLQREEEKRGRALSAEFAARSIEAGLGFLQLIALFPEAGPFRPAPRVDDAWHVFLLYTREYMEFCERVAGKYIHHVPADFPGSSDGEGLSLCETVKFMEARGIPFDPEIWGAENASGNWCLAWCGGCAPSTLNA
ncbi:MAG: hypothetical protein JO360_13085 [Acidobacteria bacterium]|nr:hypothetical protein [Acidobacteriota bacterium]